MFKSGKGYVYNGRKIFYVPGRGVYRAILYSGLREEHFVEAFTIAGVIRQIDYAI